MTVYNSHLRIIIKTKKFLTLKIKNEKLKNPFLFVT